MFTKNNKKKLIFFGILSIFLLVSVTVYSIHHFKTIEVSANDFKKKAIEDNYIVYEDFEMINGYEIWQEFISKTRNGKKATVQIATIIDNEMFTTELIYNGNAYTCVPGETSSGKISKEYKYLKEVTGIIEASGKRENLIALTNDENITYEEISKSFFSSQSTDRLDTVLVIHTMTTLE